MANPELSQEEINRSLRKPIRGAAMLERRGRRAELVAHERREMDAAKRRDGHKCRWPACEFAGKKLPIEGAHAFQHRGVGGNPDGSRTARKLIVSLCKIHHSLVDRAELEIEALTNEMADGPLAFFRRAESGRMQHVASESRIGVSEARS